MPSEDLSPLTRIFSQRLRHILDVCDIKETELAREYLAQYHVRLSLAPVSYWLNGRHKMPPHHYLRVKTPLAAHLKMATTMPKYGLEQELWDWDGLVYHDEQLKREKHRPSPVILGDLPHSRPGAGHFYRIQSQQQSRPAPTALGLGLQQF